MTPIEREAKTGTNDDELLVEPLGANSSKVVINVKLNTFLFIGRKCTPKWCAQGRNDLFASSALTLRGPNKSLRPCAHHFGVHFLPMNKNVFNFTLITILLEFAPKASTNNSSSLTLHWLRFYWSLLPRVQPIIRHHSFRFWLGAQ